MPVWCIAYRVLALRVEVEECYWIVSQASRSQTRSQLKGRQLTADHLFVRLVMVETSRRHMHAREDATVLEEPLQCRLAVVVEHYEW